MAEKEILREGLNVVEVIGVLAEKSLEVREFEGKDGKYEAITGKLVIRTEEGSNHDVHLFAKKLTKDGSESKMFKGYQTIIDEYLSLAEIAETGIEAEPTVLSVKGSFGINDYYSETKSDMVSRYQINGKFISRITGEHTPKATFNVEFFIAGLKKETKKEGEDTVETGRLEVKAVIPAYNGNIVPMTFVVTDEDEVAEYFESTFSKGETVEMWGEVVNKQIITKKEKKGFGKKNENTSTSFVNELVITGGDEDALDEEKGFEASLIKKALAERTILLEDKKNKAIEKKNNPSKTEKKGFGKSSSGKATSSSAKKSSVSVDDDDIPF